VGKKQSSLESCRVATAIYAASRCVDSNCESGKSFNQVAVEALTTGAGQNGLIFDDLDFLIGSMSTKEAKALARNVSAQRRVDPKLWR
jgi:hypothetical protein